MSTPAQDTVNEAKPQFASTREALLASVDDFMGRNPGITDEQIGYRSVKDASIIERLRHGGDCTTRKLDAIIRYLRNPKKKR